jgi:hypothetical protein
MPQGYPQGYSYGGQGGYAYPPPHPGQVSYPPGYMPPPPGYPAMPQGYPQPYPGQPYPGQPYPGQPMMPPGYPQQPYPGQPMMPPGYAMPPHPGMATGPLPAPVAAPPVPTAEAVPAAVPAPVAAPAAPLPAPVAAALLAPVVAPIPVPVAAAEAGTVEAAPADEAGLPQLFHPEAAHDFGPPPKRHPLIEFWRKAGGGSLTLSIAIHVGLLLLAGLVVFTSTQTIKNVDFLPGGGTAQGAQASQDLQHKVQQKRRSTIAKTTPMKKVVSNNSSSSIQLPEAPADILDVPDVSSMLGGGSLGGGGFGKGGGGGGFGNGMGMGAASGFVSLPPTMRARCSTTERLEKLRQNGGSSECEAAVSRALEWLKTKQNSDGSWGTGNKAGMTGMALLCYLGRCETPESPFYGDNVMKGIMYLIELGKKNEHGFFSENPKAISAAYEHGIATYALGEMYTLARLGSKSLPGMRESFEKGVKLIIDHQNETGGWDYYTANLIEKNMKNSKRDDLSVVGWQYQALKAGKNTSLKIPGLHEAVNKAMKYIETTQTDDGGFGGRKRDEHYNQWSLTGAGVLGLQTMAKNKTAAVNKGIKFMREFITAEPLDWNRNCNLYCWYYYTQSFFQKGGDDWKFYNEQLLPQLLNNQAPDGSWKPERPNWDAGAAGNREGGVYKTALCTLQLEVYYRYLKVADRDEDSFFDK